MDYRLELSVLSEDQSSSLLGLTLYNLSGSTLSNWSLQFIFERFIQPASFTNGHIKQVGSFCEIVTDSCTIANNECYYCQFNIDSLPLRFYSHGIKEALIVDLKDKLKLPVVVEPIALASTHSCQSQLTPPKKTDRGLIPKPNKIIYLDGNIALPNSEHMTVKTSLAEKAAAWLKQELNVTFGHQKRINNKNDITFAYNPSIRKSHYHLLVNSNGIVLEASTPCGFVHACATLIQLIKKVDDNLVVPWVKIFNQPRFTYRGVMLDCARHFHSIETIKRLINHLAYYKFNQFHWHLTDDEGWRLEIKAFPQLTKIGSKRGQGSELEPQLGHLTSTYSGYYTQQQVREVITYAEARGISVIPEIDIPGHCRAAIKSLPHLLIDPSDSSQYRSIQNYTDNVLSPNLSGTYQFIDRVLEEVAILFPSPWIHVGSDEVPEGVWEKNYNCQALMTHSGYENISELQGHILHYAEKKLTSLGKRMLGWEEIKQGNKVSKDTIIFSWQNEKAALDCAKQGIDVVLQPAQATYLDMVQDFSPHEPGTNWAGVLTLDKAYQYEPVAEIPEDSPIYKHILGIQCALWCENISDQTKIDYMLFPRLTAIAETCWTFKQQRNWPNYQARLKQHFWLMDKQHINYRYPWKQASLAFYD